MVETLWSFVDGIDEGKMLKSRDVKFLNKFKAVDEFEEIIDSPFPKESKNDVVQGSATEVKPIDSEFESPEPEQPVQDLPVSTPTPIMKRGPGRPRKEKTGKRGRPKKIYNTIPIVAETANVAVTPDPFNIKEA